MFMAKKTEKKDQVVNPEEVSEQIVEEQLEQTEDCNQNDDTENLSEDKKFFRSLVEKNQGDYLKSLFEYCFHKNLFFSEKVYNLIVRRTSDEDLAKLPEIYEDGIRNNAHYNSISFFDQLHLENFEEIYSEELKVLSLSEENKKDRQQIVSIIGYDPFEDNLPEDKPQLYRDLTGMLTDGMRKDIPKAKAAVEVVVGYNNIRKYQNRVNALINTPVLSEDEQKQLDKLLEMITKIQNSLNAINDKNGFSNPKSIGSNGRGTLSEVMRTVNEKSYDPGQVNAYDIITSNAIEQIADISNKSILNQVKLSGQDYSDMLAEQAIIVHKAQKKAREAEEGMRLAKAMLKRQELIEKLEQEYKNKGIDEQDIHEFIEREYKMWEK